MDSYFLDTNFILRFLIGDNKKQLTSTRSWLEKAQNKKVELILNPFTILEAEYVMRKVYKFSRKNIGEKLTEIVENEAICVKERLSWKISLPVYLKTKIDLNDILLFVLAQKENCNILSFDKDFIKLEKLFRG